MAQLALVMIVCACVGCASGPASDMVPVPLTPAKPKAAPLLDRELDLAPFLQVEDDFDHTRYRVLGPFIEVHQDANGRMTYAFRPLFSRFENFANEQVSQDILYPLLTYRLLGERLVQSGFIGISINDNVDDSESPWQSYLLPVYFNGRGKEGQRYFAIWPLGGIIRDVFSYKVIKFALWPLYMKTVKSTGLVNHHVLWPIFHKGDRYAMVNGEKVLVQRKRKIFPLIGYNEDHKKGWRGNFFLWPLFHWGYSLKPEVAPGWAFGIFPLFSYAGYQIPAKNQKFRSWNFLFPFFMYAKATMDDPATGRKHKLVKHYAPWPFFQYYREYKELNGVRELVTKRTYLWPIWGQDLKRGAKETFWFYPLYFHYDRPIPDGRRKMTYLAIAFMHAEDELANGEWSRFTRLWPLMAYERDSKQNRSLTILDIFPLRHVHAIERNWAPIWTLYRYLEDKEKFSHDLLWGWVQFKKKKGGEILDLSIFPFFNYEISGRNKIRKFSLLLGLYGSKVFKDGTIDRQILWLWSQRRKDGKFLGHGIFPLYNYRKSDADEVTDLSIFLGLYGKKALSTETIKRRYAWLFTKTKTNGTTVGHGLFPLYNRKKSVDGKAKELNVLGGLWGSRHLSDGSSETRLLWGFRIKHGKPDEDPTTPKP